MSSDRARHHLQIAFTLLILAIPVQIAAQNPITLDDIRQLPSTPWLEISPDGRRVAYLHNTPGAGSDLWMVPSEGGAPSRLTEGVTVRSVIGWNTRGDQLAFVAPHENEAALWLLQPGSDPALACPLPRGARSIAWLPDGAQLSFSAQAAAASGPAARSGADAPRPGESIFLCDPRVNEVRAVTRRGYHGLEFSWAPAGDRIAVSAQARPGFYEALESDLLLVDATTGEETPLVTRPGVDRSPMWSPDGSQIAFVSGFGRSGLLPNLGIAVVRPGDSAPRDVGRDHDRGGFFEGPSIHGWSPDGSHIYYSVLDGLRSPLFRVSATSGAYAEVPVPASAREVAYQYSVSGDGRMLAFKLSALNRPPEIFAVELGRPEAVRLTTLHGSVTGIDGVLAEPIRWTAPDGTEIEGILVRPPLAAGPGPYPLVTVLHGGPASAYNLSFPSLGFFDPYQDLLLAARGYAVFLPNPRGSGGYGERFRRAVQRDWGRLPAADVNAGIDRLIAEGIVDSTRLALVGWSYGGYLAAWMLAHSDRFAVGSVGAGVYDLTSHYGQAAPQVEEYFGGRPWRLPELYREQSPIHHAARLRTPTLIFHGTTDNAVSIAQSELLYAALRAEGVPVEFVTYPGEGHSLRQTAAQDDSWNRLFEWIDRWIGSGTAPVAPGPAS